MTMRIQRVFSTLPTRSAPSNRQQPAIEDMRLQLQRALQDCQGAHVQGLLLSIKRAKTPAELWNLRSDLHQCIFQKHGPRVAAARINSLMDVFEGYLPSSWLTRREE